MYTENSLDCVAGVLEFDKDQNSRCIAVLYLHSKTHGQRESISEHQSPPPPVAQQNDVLSQGTGTPYARKERPSM